VADASVLTERVKAMPDGVTDDAAASDHWEDVHIILSVSLFTITMLFCALPAIAEIRIVTSQGEHRMGDRDTREDAVRLATVEEERDRA
jgi:hypothetical protein